MLPLSKLQRYTKNSKQKLPHRKLRKQVRCNYDYDKSNLNQLTNYIVQCPRFTVLRVTVFRFTEVRVTVLRITGLPFTILQSKNSYLDKTETISNRKKMKLPLDLEYPLVPLPLDFC